MKAFLSVTKYATVLMTHLLLLLAILMALLLLLPKAKGVELYTVLSSSMEPTLPVGSIIYVSPCKSPLEIQKQDIIAYEAETTLVVHRVIKADRERGIFITKGDFNKVEDASPVAFEDIVGKVDFHIPWVGYGLMTMQRKEFRYLLLVLAGILLVLNLPNKNRRTYEQEDIEQS